MNPQDNSATLPNLWDEPLLRSYLGEVKRYHGVVETLALPNMRDLPPIRIEQLFVQPLLSRVIVDATSSYDSWPAGESLLEVLSYERRIVLLGDPGSGKTTLANWLAWRLSSGLTASLPDSLEGKLPVPCVLRDMPLLVFGEDVSIAELAEHIAVRLLGEKANGPLREAIRRRIEAGQYVLILDGVDEIPLALRPQIARWMRQAMTDQACVLGTARIVGYEDYPVDRAMPPLPDGASPENFNSRKPAERVQDIEGTKVPHGPVWAAMRYLMPFDQKRIANFVENWYLQRSGGEHEARARAEDFMAALEKSEQMQELARTPNLLSLMAIVHRERAHLPDGKALLYKEISNAYINTIDKHRKILVGDAIAQYSWEARENWIAYVAFRMQLQRDKGESDEAGLLASEQEVVAWLAEAMALSQLPNPTDTAPQFLEWVARRCGLLIPRGNAEYAFVHLSFQEYFCARFIAGRVMSRPFIKDLLDEEAPVTKARLYDWAEASEWLECYVFLFEIISAENDIDWVQDLADIVFDGPAPGASLADSRALLAARVLTDRHIHLRHSCRSRLGEGCAQEAFEEWFYFGDWHSLFKLYSETEFAGVFADGEGKSDLSASGLIPQPATAMESVESIRNLCVVIGRGKSIVHIDALRHAAQLRYVSMVDTGVSDISPLAFTRDLRKVEFTESPITDISPLAKSAGISGLYLKNTNVSDLSPVAALKQLDSLDISGSKVSSVASLAKLEKLSFLSARHTGIAEIGALAKLRSLMVLNMNDTKLSDLSALRNIRLHGLNIENTLVEDISPICSLQSLTDLRLAGSRVKDHHMLARLPRLRFLSVGNEHLMELSFMTELKQLTSITLVGPTIGDVSVLTQLRDLQYVKLVNTAVTDLSPLLELQDLRSLIVNGVQISDIRSFIMESQVTSAAAE